MTNYMFNDPKCQKSCPKSQSKSAYNDAFPRRPDSFQRITRLLYQPSSLKAVANSKERTYAAQPRIGEKLPPEEMAVHQKLTGTNFFHGPR
jgi:hypothetical protein